MGFQLISNGMVSVNALETYPPGVCWEDFCFCIAEGYWTDWQGFVSAGETWTKFSGLTDFPDGGILEIQKRCNR